MVYAYCCKWRLKANVSKSEVMLFARESVDWAWKWKERFLPRVSKYTYLGVDFTSTGAWDEHIRKVLDNGRKMVNRIHSVNSNWLLLLAVVRPTLEYGSEVWEAN